MEKSKSSQIRKVNRIYLHQTSLTTNTKGTTQSVNTRERKDLWKETQNNLEIPIGTHTHTHTHTHTQTYIIILNVKWLNAPVERYILSEWI